MHLAARDPDAKPRPVVVLGGGALRDALKHERRARGAERVIRDARVLSEDDHQLVADDLVHLAAGALHQRDDAPEVRVEHRGHLVRLVPLGERGVAGEVGEDDAHLACACERLVEVERAEALLVPLGSRDERDEQERPEHQHVPLPPRDLPVARPRDDDHGLGEQDEREREGEHESLLSSSMEPQEPERGETEERDSDRGEDQLPAVELLVRDGIVERGQLGEGDCRPHGDDELRA